MGKYIVYQIWSGIYLVNDFFISWAEAGGLVLIALFFFCQEKDLFVEASDTVFACVLVCHS